MKTVLLVCVLTVSLVSPGRFGVTAAFAHAFLDHADPRVGATVDASPAALTLVFTERVEASFSRIEVYDAAGKQISANPVQHPTPAVLRLPLPQLPAGTYTARWAVTSEDAHQTEGYFEFTVARP